MISEAIKYLISLAKPEVVDICGQKYSSGLMKPVYPEEPAPLIVHTLTGLTNFISSGCMGKMDDQIIHVNDFDSVSFRSRIMEAHNRRHIYIHAQAVPMISDAKQLVGRSIDEMIVMLETCFESSGDREAVIKLIGNITDASSVKTTDDGITQQINVKKGISLQGVANMPKVIELFPWRSFPEIMPQSSKWLIRVDRSERTDAPLISLHEINREHWRAMTIIAIGEYMRNALENQYVVIA